MFKQIIPGHFRALTWWVTLGFGLMTYGLTGSPVKAFGVMVLLLGMFLADQTVHLVQENHRGVRATWIEKKMQDQYWLFFPIGIAVALIGVLLLSYG